MDTMRLLHPSPHRCAVPPSGPARQTATHCSLGVDQRRFSCSHASAGVRRPDRVSSSLLQSHHAAGTRGATLLRAHAAPEATTVHSTDAPLRAVVIGAGLAGLATAHTLCGLFDEVTLLERDDVAKAPASAEDASQDQLTGRSRPGVSQFSQPHLLLKGGMLQLSKMFGADFEQTLLDAGGVSVNWLEECTAFNFNRYIHRRHVEGPNGTGQCTGVTATRALYEATVRREVTKNENLELLSGVRATNYTFSDGSVTGVQLSDGRQLATDLVVDATGRNSQTPAWLGARGYEKPPEVSISANLGYGTCVFDAPNYYAGDNKSKAYVVFATPPNKRGAVLWEVEGGKIQVILSGYSGDHPPADHAGFLEFARSLPAPDVYDKLKDATPLTPVMCYKRTDNFRRRYEEITMPDGLCVIGDAVAAFNPVYGQGMTVGVLQAVQLRDMAAARLGKAGSGAAAKRKALQGLPAAFHAKLPEVLDFPWNLATGEDLKHTQGQQPESAAEQKPALSVEGLLKRYFAFVQTVSADDPVMQLTFWRVFHMVGSPAEMFSPNIAWRTARLWLLGKVQALQGGSSGGGGGGGGTGQPAPGSVAVVTAAAAAQNTR